MMTLDIFIALFLLTAIICDVSLAIYVLQKDPRNAMNQTYFGLMLFIASWQATHITTYYFPLSSLVIFLTQYAFFAAAVFSSLMVYFVLIFSSRKHKWRMLYICAGLGIFMGSFGFFDIIAQLNVESFTVGSATFTYNWFFPYYFAFIFFGLYGSLIIALIKRNKVQEVRLKRQLAYCILGLSVPVVFSTFTHIMVPFFYYVTGETTHFRTDLYGFAPASYTFFSAMVAYAIMKHRLMGIHLIFKRERVEIIFISFCTVITTILYAFIVHTFFSPIMGSYLFFLTGILFIGMCYVVYRNLIVRILRMYIKQEHIDLYEWTPQELSLIKQATTLQNFCGLIGSYIQKRIPIENIIFLVYDHSAGCFRSTLPSSPTYRFSLQDEWLVGLKNEPDVLFFGGSESTSDRITPKQYKSMQGIMHQLHAQICIPLVSYDRLLGVILLSQKLDGTDFSQKDKEYFVDLQQRTAEQLANMLQAEYAFYVGLEQKIQSESMS